MILCNLNLINLRMRLDNLNLVDSMNWFVSVGSSQLSPLQGRGPKGFSLCRFSRLEFNRFYNSVTIFFGDRQPDSVPLAFLAVTARSGKASAPTGLRL